MADTVAEQKLLEARETRRSFGPVKLLVGILLLGLPFLGRQRVTVTNQRILLEEGFWSRTRDDVEIFRIRDVVVRQSLAQRIFGVGDVVIKSTEGRSEEQHVLRGLRDPVHVAETIRTAWNQAARPRGPAATLD
ncbi:PH domain-containing protein [Plastoroseomonas hellenica]|uniref:PH domain-containing protein n=1 Tax=Plastoroseomonas hellenica TaxID=2687306 RepID=UPI001BABA7A6|nr:PH domain-containing protein [Plastoroseomonas hellenica]MBR0647697.1 PH domain-containing protein [Plastoroseomonas hellenica]